MALDRDRQTNKLADVTFDTHDVAAGVVIYVGAQVALNATGYLVPATEDTTFKVIGCSGQHVDNTDGADGDERCEVQYGAFAWNNSAGADEITARDIGAVAYAVDDETVALTDATGTRPVAGVVVRFDADRSSPFVLQGPQYPALLA